MWSAASSPRYTARRLHVRHRPVARHAAARVRRAVRAAPARRSAAEVELVRLDPQFRYHWRDGSTLTVVDDDDATAASFDGFSGGAGAQWRSFDARGRRIWDVAERTFFAGPMTQPAVARQAHAIAVRPHRDRPVPHTRPLGRARTSTTTGWCSGPDGTPPTRGRRRSGRRPRSPASPTSRRAFGCWYPMRWARHDPAMRSNALARACGVELRTGAEVDRRSRPTPIGSTASTSPTAPTSAADVVVANVDAEHLYTDLLARPDGARDASAAAERSTSGFALCAAVRGLTPGMRAPQRVVLRGRARRVRRDRARRARRRPDDLRLRLVGHRSDAGTRRMRELVPARQHAAGRRGRTGSRHRPRARPLGRCTAFRSAVGSSSSTR